MQEYVCADGRMSVNGICLTHNQGGENTFKNYKLNNDKQDPDYMRGMEPKDFSKDVKSSFEWDFDKAGNKIENFGSTINGNIKAYDDYIEDKLGIPTDVSQGLRIGSAIYGATQYGALGVLGPFAIPFIAGGALNSKQKKENERIAKATMKDTQGDNNMIDMMTYNIPTYGNEGFNIHSDAGDQGNSGNNNYGGATQSGGFDKGGFEQDGTGRQGY